MEEIIIFWIRVVVVEVVRNNWDLMYILKIDLIEIVDGLDMGYEEKKEIRS